MKKFLQRIEGSGILMFLTVALLAVFGIAEAGVMTADVVNPASGGAVDVGEGSDISRGQTDEESVNLILDQLDKEVAKIRPYDVVLDTIARNIKDVKTSSGQIVRHYAIDVIDVTSKIKTAHTYASGTSQIALDTEDNSIFASEQTLLVKGVAGYMQDGTTEDPKHDLLLYVVGRNESGLPIVRAFNGRGANNADIPSLAVGDEVVALGRAASEKQIATDAYSGVPTDIEQYLQKFIAQVEMTDIFQKADKEVKWTFSDAEEEAIFDMKRKMNLSFWLSSKHRKKFKNAHSSNKEEDVFTTEGIWNQAGKDFTFEGTVTPAKMTSLMKMAFTGTNSGKKKLLICGSDALEAFENLYVDTTNGYTANIKVGERKAAYGIEFTEYISKFGTLLVTHDQSLNDLGMSDKAFILDPDFLRKWTMGWRVTNFDLRKSGQSDSDARALMEICGLVLKNPKAHVRVSIA